MAKATAKATNPAKLRLHEVRAAQLRARAVRGALIKLALATAFLVGAIAHALAPNPHDRDARLWMTALILLSTFNVAQGLQAICRVRRLRPVFWMLGAGAWGGLGVILLALLLRR
jgi:hypothetical protein